MEAALNFLRWESVARLCCGISHGESLVPTKKTDVAEEFDVLVNNSIGLGIAYLITKWASAELKLKFVLFELTLGHAASQQDLVGLAPFVGMDTRAVIGLIRTVIPARLGDHAAAIADIALKKIETGKALRDFVAHATWQQKEFKKKHKDDQRMIARTLKTVGTVAYSQRVIDPIQLFRAGKNIAEAADRLIEILKAHGFCENFARSLELSS